MKKIPISGFLTWVFLGIFLFICPNQLQANVVDALWDNNLDSVPENTPIRLIARIDENVNPGDIITFKIYKQNLFFADFLIFSTTEVQSSDDGHVYVEWVVPLDNDSDNAKYYFKAKHPNNFLNKKSPDLEVTPAFVKPPLILSNVKEVSEYQRNVAGVSDELLSAFHSSAKGIFYRIVNDKSLDDLIDESAENHYIGVSNAMGFYNHILNYATVSEPNLPGLVTAVISDIASIPTSIAGLAMTGVNYITDLLISTYWFPVVKNFEDKAWISGPTRLTEPGDINLKMYYKPSTVTTEKSTAASLKITGPFTEGGTEASLGIPLGSFTLLNQQRPTFFAQIVTGKNEGILITPQNPIRLPNSGEYEVTFSIDGHKRTQSITVENQNNSDLLDLTVDDVVNFNPETKTISFSPQIQQLKWSLYSENETLFNNQEIHERTFSHSDLPGGKFIVQASGTYENRKDIRILYEFSNDNTKLSVTPEDRPVPIDSGDTSFNVTNAGTGTMAWSAEVVSGMNWLSIENGAEGSNNGTISCHYNANTTAFSRTGEIYIQATGAVNSPMTVTVTQEAHDIEAPAHWISISPEHRPLSRDAGNTSFFVSNAGTDTMDWTAEVVSGSNWLTITSGANGSNAGTVSCQYDANTTAFSRFGQICITALGAGNSPVTVTLEQAALGTLDPPGWIDFPDESVRTNYYVSWASSDAGDVTYVLEEATDPDFSSNRRTAYSGTRTYAHITDRVRETIYYYRVKAIKSGHIDSEWRIGDFSGCRVTTPVLFIDNPVRIVTNSGDDCDNSFDIENHGSGQMIWSAELVSGNDWLSITSSQYGEEVTYETKENFGPSSRTAVIRITAPDAQNSPMEVTVTQPPGEDTARNRIPDTGQYTSYTDIFGEDADHTGHPPSYTKLDSDRDDLPSSSPDWAMIRDNVTGLVWENKTDDDSIHGKNAEYTWQDAGNVFIARLNADKFGGYSDWRLPTARELYMLIHGDQHNPSIHTEFFQNTVSSCYWTSNTHVSDTATAWQVCFEDNGIHPDDKLVPAPVRAVRGGHIGAAPALVDNGDQTVTDPATGLIWQQETVPGTFNWTQALTHIQNLNTSGFGGYSDWRLPNIKELASLIDHSQSGTPIDPLLAFMTQPGHYWSSTTNTNNSDQAWLAGFDTGIVNQFNKSGSFYVRAVRDKKSKMSGDTPFRMQVATSGEHFVGLKDDGTVVAVGENGEGQTNVSGWTDIIQIAAGDYHTVGLKADGTVLIAGGTGYCEPMKEAFVWSDIIQIAAGYDYTVGLKADGTVVAVGDDWLGKTNVSGWTDIKQVSAGRNHTVGLKADGTVVAVGKNGAGQTNVSGWTNIIQVAAAQYHTVGLKADGSVVTVGCVGNSQTDVSGWTDIIQVAAGEDHTVGLKADGTVVFTNMDDYDDFHDFPNSDWNDIVQVAAGDWHSTLGLKDDGNVVTMGGDSSWTDEVEVTEWMLSTFCRYSVNPVGGHFLPKGGKGSIVISTSYPNCAWTASTDLPWVHLSMSEGNGVQTIEIIVEENTGAKRNGSIIVAGKTYTISQSAASASSSTQMQVAAGDSHTVGLKDDGTLVAVGENTYGQLNVSDWDNIIQVATNEYHTVGLKADGTVIAVGDNEDGQANVAGWYAMMQVAAGRNHTVGLKADGTVVAAGDNGYGQSNISEWSNIIQVEAGKYHSIGLKADGTVVAVGGDDFYGQTDVSGWTDIIQVATGNYHTVGLKADGTLVIAGKFDYWFLDQVDVADALAWRDIIQVAINEYCIVGLKSDGTILAVGDYEILTNWTTMTYITEWQDIIQIAAADEHVIGLRADGTVMAVGYNHSGHQIDATEWLLTDSCCYSVVPKRGHFSSKGGIGSLYVSTSYPNCAWSVSNNLSWVDLSTSGGTGDQVMEIFVTENSGPERAGSITIAEKTYTVYQAAVSDSTTVNMQIAAGSGHTVGLKDDGTVVAAGYDSDGETNVFSWSHIIQVAASDEFTLGLRSNGTVAAAGYTGYLEKGRTKVSEWSNIIQVTAGDRHAAGLKSDGTVVAVGGDDFYGQTGVSGWYGMTQVAAGDEFTLGLRSDGTVLAVGDNGEGQINLAGWSNIIQVAAGDRHAVGLKADGTVVAVGDNGDGRTDVSEWSKITQVAAGGDHTVGLKTDGTVMAVGANNSGQCNVSGWSDIIQVVAGEFHTVGLKEDGSVVAVGGNGNGQIDVTGWMLKTNQKPVPDYILSENFDSGNFSLLPWQHAGPWQHTGNAGWAVQNQAYYNGGYAAESGTIGDTQASHMEFSVTVRSGGTLSFWYRVNSESDSDFLRFYVNETEQAVWSGNIPWNRATFDLEPGIHLLRWSYTKDESGSGGSDAAWVDNITLAGKILSESCYTVTLHPGENGTILRANSEKYYVMEVAEGMPLPEVIVNPDFGYSFSGWNPAPPEKITADFEATALYTDDVVIAWGENYSGQTTVPEGLINVKAIAAGGSQTVALLEDGTVVEWGAYGEKGGGGRATVPQRLINVKAIAAGGSHTAALLEDGTVLEWWGSGQTTGPEGLTNVKAIAAGWGHTVALLEDGTVVAWGINYWGQATVPEELLNVKAIAAGGYHTVALLEDGTVVAWGANWDGQATVPEELLNVKAIAAGGNHTVALLEDGTVVAWGSSDNDLMPESLNNVKAIAAGGNHTVALLEDGTVVAWGSDWHGQTTVPEGLINVKAIAAGFQHTVALLKENDPVIHTVRLNAGSHGSITQANTGPDYMVSLLPGDAFPVVEVVPDESWIFTGWDIPLPDTVTADFEATALYEEDILDPSDPDILTHSGPGTSFLGRWTSVAAADAFQGDSMVTQEDGAAATFDTNHTGCRTVSLWWTQDPGHHDAVPVEIYDDITLVDTVYVNQQTGGGQWQELGTYFFNHGAVIVVVSDSSTHTTSVDAVRTTAADDCIHLPISVSNLEATVLPDEKIRLNWDHSNSPDIDRYNVYWDAGTGTMNYTTPLGIVTFPDHTFTTVGLGEGKYHFVVRSQDQTGNEEKNQNTVAAQIDTTPPLAVDNVSVAPISGDSVMVSWSPSTSNDVAFYRIYSDNGTGVLDMTSPVAVLGSDASSWISGNLTAEQYIFSVVAVDHSGNFQTPLTTQKEIELSFPDLVVESVDWTPSEFKFGDSVQFNAVVKNNGTRATDKGFFVTFNCDDFMILYHFHKDPVQPGESVEINSTWRANIVSKPYTLTVRADDFENRVIESNEENNELAVDFAILPDYMVAFATERKSYVAGEQVLFKSIVANSTDPNTYFSDTDVNVSFTLKDESGGVMVSGEMGSDNSAGINEFVGILDTQGFENGEYMFVVTATGPGGEKSETGKIVIVDDVILNVITDKQIYDLNESVVISGNATTIDGSPINGAAVKIKVTARGFTRWFSVETDENGGFSYWFKPNRGEGGQFFVTVQTATNGLSRSDDVQFFVEGLFPSPGRVTLDMTKNTSAGDTVHVTNVGTTSIQGLSVSLEDRDQTDLVTARITSPGLGDSVAAGQKVSVQIEVISELAVPDVAYFDLIVSGTNVADQTIPITVRLHEPLPAPVIHPKTFTLGGHPGDLMTKTITLTNGGYGYLNNVRAVSADLEWITIIGADMGTLAPSESRTFEIWAKPGDDVSLGIYQTTVTVVSDEGEFDINARIDVNASQTGIIRFNLGDDTGSSVNGANVTLISKETYALETLSGSRTYNHIVSSRTDEQGNVVFTGVPVGDYRYQVDSGDHDSVTGATAVSPGDSSEEIEIDLARNLVQVKWTVTPTEITDKYTIDLKLTFETEIPKPVLLMSPYWLEFSMDEGEVETGQLTVTNPSLVEIRNIVIDSSGLDGIDLFFDGPDGPSKTFRIDVLAPNESGNSIVNIPYKASLKQGAERVTRDLGSLLGKGEYTYFSHRSSGNDPQPKTGYTHGEVPVKMFIPVIPDIPGLKKKLRTRPRFIHFTDYCADTPVSFPIFNPGVHRLLAYNEGEDAATLGQAIGFTVSLSAMELIGEALKIATGVKIITALALNDTISSVWYGDFADPLLDPGENTEMILAELSTTIMKLNLPDFGFRIGLLGFGYKWATDIFPKIHGLPIFITTICDGNISIPIGFDFGTVDSWGGFGGGSGGTGGWHGYWPDSGSSGWTSSGLTNINLPEEPPGPTVRELVKLKISQDAALEREAFDAEMEITPLVRNLDQVRAKLLIRDKDGHLVNDLFNYTVKFLEGVDTIDGSDTISIDETGKISWIIVPGESAGGIDPAGQDYTIGAKLYFSVGGKPFEYETAYVPVVVKPQPSLRVDYYIPSEVTAKRPFQLKVVIHNDGPGIARNFRIKSAQPQIIENLAGLLVNFTIHGSGVGSDYNPGDMEPEFGDIFPGQTVHGYWIMSSSLDGEFTDFSADMVHHNHVGMELNPLIRSVTIQHYADDAISDSFESGDFSGLPWQHAGDENWTVQDQIRYDGTYAARSGDVGPNQSSHMELAVTVPSGGAVSFWYRIRSENNDGFLRFYVNGAKQAVWSGDIPWTRVTFDLEPGTYLLRWSYSRGGNVSIVSDAAWVDQIMLTGAVLPEIFTVTLHPGEHGTITGPTPQTVTHGDNSEAVTALPDTGYHFVQWSDGSTANPRTFENVISDISVTAVFDYVKGDVNLDCKVNMKDAILLIQYAAGRDDLTDAQKKRGNISGHPDDNQVGMADAIRIFGIMAQTHSLEKQEN
jgi:alpha-tubulin suppressor-like RCC1 family protein